MAQNRLPLVALLGICLGVHADELPSSIDPPSVGRTRVVLPHPEDPRKNLVDVDWLMPEGTGLGISSVRDWLAQQVVDNEIPLSVAKAEAFAIPRTKAQREAEDLGCCQCNYTMFATSQLIRKDTRVVSMVTDIYCDTGGAHGNSKVDFASFDAATGEKLDVLAHLSDGQAAILQRQVNLRVLMQTIDLGDPKTLFNRRREICAQVREMLADTTAALKKAGIETNDAGDVPLHSGVYALATDGLRVCFNAYAIGSYSLGVFDFTIPYAQLQGVLPAAWLPPPSGR